MYEIYCDGSCKNNGGVNPKAAYAFILFEITPDYQKELYRESGKIENGTNNIAEMTAMLKALEYWKENYGDSVLVHCDSAYVVNAYRQKWIDNWRRNGWMTKNRTPVKNKELWIELDKFFQDRQNVRLDKVEGHSNVYWNNVVDGMAQGEWDK